MARSPSSPSHTSQIYCRPTPFALTQTVPSVPRLSVSPLLNLQCSPVTPRPATCLNVSQTYSAPRLYIHWASSIFPITPQPPFTCLPLSHPSPGSRIPHPTKFYPHPSPNLSSICAPLTSDFIVSSYICPKASPFPHMSISSYACLCFLLPSFPNHHSLSSLISLHPHSPAFSALLFADSVAQSIFPNSPVWGGCLVPLNAAWET